MTIRGTTNPGAGPGAASRYGLDQREVPAKEAARTKVAYACPAGHTFAVTLAADASAPDEWDCRCGRTGRRADRPQAVVEEVPARHRDSSRAMTARTSGPHGPARTPWNMLTERRTRQELQDLLDERLDLLRTGRLRPDGTRR